MFQHITLAQVLRLSGPIVSVYHGHLLLKAILRQLKDSMGPTFVKTKWVESEQQLKDWMKEDQVIKILFCSRRRVFFQILRACRLNRTHS